MSAWSDGRPVFLRLPEEGYQDNETVNWVTQPVDSKLIAIKTAVDNLAQDFLDPATCREDALDWLAQYHGFTGEYWDASWPAAQKRRILLDAFSFIWPNKGRRSLLEYFFEVFNIQAKFYQPGIWIAGVTKAGSTFGGTALFYVIKMPFGGETGYLPTSYEWKLTEKLNRLYMPCFTRSRVQYSRWIAGFSRAGDIYFDPNPYELTWGDRIFAAGGAIDNATLKLVDEYFEKPLVQAGLKDRFKLCHLFIGSGINTQKVPYIGLTNATPVSCTDADFTASGGFTGDGIVKYANLGVSPNSLGLTIDNMQLIVYGSNLGGAVTRGILTATGPGATRNILYRESDQSYRGDFDANAGNIAFVTTAVGNGMVAAQSPSGAMQRMNLNGLSAGFDPNSAYRSGASSTGNLIALAYDNAGSVILQSPASLRWLGVTERMSDSEMRLLYNIVEQLQCRLGRSATGATAQSLIVNDPVPFQVFQRDTTGQATIKIRVYYAGAATTIRARWNGGDWAAIASPTKTGIYVGALGNQLSGQGTLEVKADNSSAIASVACVGVGDVLWVNGQSNAAGQFNNAQPYSHPTLKASKFQKYRTWEEFFSPDGAYIAGSSVWGRVATLMMAYTGAPVGIVNCGVGSTTLVASPAHWNAVTGTAFDQSVYTFNQIESGGARAILWHQGESDTVGITQSAYNTAFDALVAALQQKTGISAKAIAAQIGQVSVSSAANIDNIRFAISEAWDDNPNVAWGPPLWDKSLVDGLHWTTDADAIELAARWWRAIKYHCFDGLSDGRAPRFQSATYTGNQITIAFQGGVMPFVLGASPTVGWAVTDGNGNRTVNAVALSGTNGIKLTCDATLAGAVTVTLGSGNTGVGNTIKDSGAIAPYPIEPFKSKTVSAA